VRELSGADMEWADGLLYPSCALEAPLVDAYCAPQGDKGILRLTDRVWPSFETQRAHWNKLHAMHSLAGQ